MPLLADDLARDRARHRGARGRGPRPVLVGALEAGARRHGQLPRPDVQGLTTKRDLARSKIRGKSAWPAVSITGATASCSATTASEDPRAMIPARTPERCGASSTSRSRGRPGDAPHGGSNHRTRSSTTRSTHDPQHQGRVSRVPHRIHTALVSRDAARRMRSRHRRGDARRDRCAGHGPAGVPPEAPGRDFEESLRHLTRRR